MHTGRGHESACVYIVTALQVALLTTANMGVLVCRARKVTATSSTLVWLHQAYLYCVLPQAWERYPQLVVHSFRTCP